MTERIRQVQPGYCRFLNAAARRTLHTATEAAEIGHWLWLLAAVPPLIFGVIVRRYGFVATLLTGTVVVNVYPIALQRLLRARLETLDHRTRYPGSSHRPLIQFVARLSTQPCRKTARFVV